MDWKFRVCTACSKATAYEVLLQPHVATLCVTFLKAFIFTKDFTAEFNNAALDQ